MSQSFVERPSFWLPIVMSLLALTIVISHIAVYGAAREPDEGTAAHLWQLLMTAQLPLIAWHAARWLPKDPRVGGKMLAFQILAIFAALAPVWWFRL